MKLVSLKSPAKRAKLASRLQKNLSSVFGTARQETRPILIGGMQRSGTTLLMDVMHLNAHVEVFDESKNSRVFKDFRLKGESFVRETIAESKFAFTAYKVICDSHLISDLLKVFPDARVIWSYRNVSDNADSQLAKFTHATRAVELVCAKEKGGGWFDEGLSQRSRKTLVNLAKHHRLTGFDFACLSWWARNALFFEQQLEQNKNVRVLRYEDMVRQPVETLRSLFEWLEVPWLEKDTRFIHARSVHKENLPKINPAVQDLCGLLDSRFSSVVR